MKISKSIYEYCFYMILIGLWYYCQFVNWNKDFLDTDNFFHAIRMIEWFKSPSFWEQKIMISNYPFGEISHWTKPIYIFWGILSVPFLFFFNIKYAVVFGGLFLCPLFLCFSVIFLLKFIRQLFNYKLRLACLVMLWMCAGVSRTAIFYRPDHHIMFLFISILLLYFNMLFFNKHKKYRVI